MLRAIDSYRQEVDRLTKLAMGLKAPSVRFELLQIASSFRRLAEFADITAHKVISRKSAGIRVFFGLRFNLLRQVTRQRLRDDRPRVRQ
jgi:hypothetical protein